MKTKFFLLIFTILPIFTFAQTPSPNKNIDILIQAYPDLQINTTYSKADSDWILSFTNNNIDYEFVWCDGRMLPREEVPNKEKYWSLLYKYAKELQDPATMTEEEKEQLKNFSSASNRKNGAGTPMFFFDAVYDSYSERIIEKHIKRTTFLGKPTRIHQRIEKPLKNVENRILVLSETDTEVKKFVDSIKSCDAFYWRLIAGTNRKSFHSLGIAIDILPVKITGEIYWSWAKDKNPDGWMLTPLSKRWLPPAKVIDIFEEEGFIFGGKWAIWDNMHFEYHPELIMFN